MTQTADDVAAQRAALETEQRQLHARLHSGGNQRAKQFGRQLKLAQESEALSQLAASVAAQRRAAATAAARAMGDAFDAAARGEAPTRVAAASSAMQAAFDHVLATHTPAAAAAAAARGRPLGWAPVGGQHPLLGPSHGRPSGSGSDPAGTHAATAPEAAGAPWLSHGAVGRPSAWAAPSRPGDRRSQSLGRRGSGPALDPGFEAPSRLPRLVAIQSRGSSVERASDGARRTTAFKPQDAGAPASPFSALFGFPPPAPLLRAKSALKVRGGPPPLSPEVGGFGAGRAALVVELKPKLSFDTVTTARTRSGRQALRDLRAKSGSSTGRPAGQKEDI